MAISRRRRHDSDRPRGGRLRRFAANALALALVALASWGATQTAIFRADRIEVTGARSLSTARILDLAGVGPRTNVVWMSPGAAEARLEATPWIADAEVRRELPDRLAIKVDERRAVAALAHRGRWAVLAEDATVLRIARKRPPLPVLVLGRPVAGLTPGSAVAGARTALEVIEALPPTLRVERAQPREGGIEVLLGSGVRIRYGDSTSAAAKNAAIQALLAWARGAGQRAALLDVRVPSAPALRAADGMMHASL